ncbi:MAG: helix-turn-helix transcriptional regulator [Sphingomonadaceae bacterium]|nr:helix-turn-helix transcriptional regulator [Sphingomonadaceae bacterium]
MQTLQPPPVSELTAKQREVLDLVLCHYSSKEIARKLGISPRSVDQRLDGARQKLGVATRIEAARVYAEACQTPQSLTSEPLPVTDPVVPLQEAGDSSAEAVFNLSDAGFMSAGEFEQQLIRDVPKLVPGKLNSGLRLLLIVGGAIAMLLLVLVGLSVVNALDELLIG